MEDKYTIGVDFGTLSARAVVANTKNGEIAAESVQNYEHGVMDRKLPDGTPLGRDWALQHPADYLKALAAVTNEVIQKSAVKAHNIIGIAIDFTSCTVLPVDAKGKPLCFAENMKSEPNAYVKLWKHHAAQPQADRMDRIAKERGERFLNRYGNRISSEAMLPKILQILEESPEIYSQTGRFMEAADFITEQLTGRPIRSNCCAGYKSFYSKKSGYPSHEFLKAVDPRIEFLFEEKLSGEILQQGTLAGYISEKSTWTGLKEGTAVAVPAIDAHVAVPAVGINKPGQLLMIMGTSGCDIICDEKEYEIPGICGVVEDGVLPGYYGYEAGQACMGDQFDWFAKNCVPEEYCSQARSDNISVQELLTGKAEKLRPGESGLLALDWWNGNRSVLSDGDLSGMILGMTLATKPEEIYRALIEATAFGKRKIVENYVNGGINVNSIYACGGISGKNKMMMQIYADVLNREIKVSPVAQTGALGAAMLAACAAGKINGGWDDIFEASCAMSKEAAEVYKPIPENAAIYDALYEDFSKLHDYFGCGGNDVMKKLKKISSEQKCR